MTLTIPVKTETLKVPGAHLYYEVRGSGPVALLMPGGPADAGAFGRVAGEMASQYTVVTYDPRGLSHSTLDAPIDDQRIVEIFADDVHRLLTATTTEPAYVFGSSGGAVIGLDLVAHHPDKVRTFVSHEPPAPILLPDPARERAAMEEIVETYRTAGIGPAMQKFMIQTRIRSGPPPPPAGEPTPEMREGMARMQRNMDFWLGHYFLAIAAYEPDFVALKAGSSRIVPARGYESRGELANEGALGLAARLGTEAVEFPGAHGGFDSHPREFAAKLREVFDS
ncbi:MAG: alpha/beta hydrolase [Candidatus Dormibacteraeota bacterium]|nr:alpha/beta hydrolase [Candidatus Dormibacteraeota bacterium]